MTRLAIGRHVRSALAIFALSCSASAIAADLPEILLWDETARDTGDVATQVLRKRIYPARESAVVVKYDPRCVASIKFTETARNSVIEDDLASLLKRFNARDAAPCPTDLAQRRLTGEARHIAKFKRSTILVVASDKDGKELARQSIVYGPEEHLSLGIDLPVDNRKTLKYDEATKTLLPTEDAPKVYLSVNYLFGDLLDSPKVFSDRVSLKLMAQASRHPLDSYGAGVSLRLDGATPLGIELKGFSVFGGYFRTREDVVVNGVAQPGEGWKNAWRVGISYDLGTGLKWAGF
jgi:hypothetical protein